MFSGDRNLEKAADAEARRDLLALAPLPSWSVAASNPPKKLTLNVHVSSDKLFLVSAYTDFRSSVPAVKIIMYASSHFDERMFCSWHGSSYSARLSWISVPAEERAIWRAGYLECQIPDLPPNSDRIVIRNSAGAAGVMMSLSHSHAEPRRRGGGGGSSVGLCIKSGYGTPSAARFVEWMELNGLLGIDHVALYDQDLRGPIRTAMQLYADEGRLTVVKDDTRKQLEAAHPPLVALLAGFDATRADGAEPFAQLELVSIQDCFHRFRGRFDYILVADIDEVLVPTKAYSLQEMLAALKSKAPVATTFAFRAASYLQHYYGTAMPRNVSGGLHMLTYTKHNDFSWDGSKAIHDTASTNSLNWHRRVDPAGDKHYVHPSDGWLHHYRSSCKGLACDGGLAIADDGASVLGKFALRLAARVGNVTARLQL